MSRIYSFSLSSKVLKLEKEIDYSSHCILKILYMSWSSCQVVVTMATDGKASFWDANTCAIFHQETVHKNGINSCDFILLENDNLVLITGGDDTAVIFSLFKKSPSCVILIDQWRNDVTHEAQVSGLYLYEIRNVYFPIFST